MKCIECGYFWQEPDEERPSYHWESRCPGDLPPCEYDDESEEE